MVAIKMAAQVHLMVPSTIFVEPASRGLFDEIGSAMSRVTFSVRICKA